MQLIETTVNRQSSLEERKSALYQIYNQVLERQPYAFERKSLASAEKDFLKDKIGVKRVLKLIGHSEVYLQEFYENSSNLKFLELCFKHFMGRAPHDHDEMHHYSDILMRKGPKTLITAMIDSEEYRKHFGCFTIPHPTRSDHYPSPKAFLESDILNHELPGRRGRVFPTMVWHELNMHCEGGSCTTAGDQADANTPATVSQSPNPTKRPSQSELLQALKSMDPKDLKQIASALSPHQRATLSQMLGQPVS